MQHEGGGVTGLEGEADGIETVGTRMCDDSILHSIAVSYTAGLMNGFAARAVTCVHCANHELIGKAHAGTKMWNSYSS